MDFARSQDSVSILLGCLPSRLELFLANTSYSFAFPSAEAFPLGVKVTHLCNYSVVRSEMSLPCLFLEVLWRLELSDQQCVLAVVRWYWVVLPLSSDSI